MATARRCPLCHARPEPSLHQRDGLWHIRHACMTQPRTVFEVSDPTRDGVIEEWRDHCESLEVA